jgi:hypothetical protein
MSKIIVMVPWNSSFETLRRSPESQKWSANPPVVYVQNSGLSSHSTPSAQKYPSVVFPCLIEYIPGFTWREIRQLFRCISEDVISLNPVARISNGPLTGRTKYSAATLTGQTRAGHSTLRELSRIVHGSIHSI